MINRMWLLIYDVFHSLNELASIVNHAVHVYKAIKIIGIIYTMAIDH